MGSRSVLIVLVLSLSVSWRAARAEERISGFVTYATGELTGRVTDEAGKPLAGIAVHAASKQGEQIVTTDKNGRYRVVLRGGTTTVFVRSVARISGETAVSSDAVPGEETVEIREHIPPAVMPKLVGDRDRIPEYSKTARDRNAWTKAWLLLEVGPKGTVERLKLLHAPGFDLDVIAVREAFKLRFTPARDRADKPVYAMMLWSFEWPSYFWMLDRKHTFNRLPREVGAVRCKGSGPGKIHRDCTPANLPKHPELPWLDPPRLLPATSVPPKR